MAPASVLESLFLQLVRRAGLPRPVLQFPHPSPMMDGRFVDAAYPEHRTLIELDGRRWHSKVVELNWDHERDIAADLAGYRHSRFSYRHVTEQGDWVAGVLRQALHAAA